MNDSDKTKEQLISELEEMRRRILNIETVGRDGKFNEGEIENRRNLAQEHLNLANTILLVVNKEQCVTLVNKRGCQILGYTEGEIVGKNWFNFVPPPKREEAVSVFKKLMTRQVENIDYFENAVLTKNGKSKIIAWNNTTIRDDQGRPTAMLSSGIDITDYIRGQAELKQYRDHLEELVDRRTAQLRASNKQLQEEIYEHKYTEEALLESQVRFAGILDIADEAIISVDESQRIALFNKGAERIFGFLATEAIGKNLDILLPERFTTQHHQHISEFANVPEPARLMGERKEIFGRRKNGQEFPAMASISKFTIGEKKIFTVVLRDITKRKQIERERELRIVELRALNDSVRAITSELSLEQVLKKVTKAAQELVQVKYAALGLHDGQGQLSRFITVGVDPAVHKKIGPLPTGRGLLGNVLHKGEAVNINNIAVHSLSSGFPENHPQMKNLLGIPLFSKGNLIGALYLTDKNNGTTFSEADRQLVEMLGVHAAIAIENAQLYAQTQRLAVLEERERFARDLHDGIIQSIYAVGLALDQAKMDIRPTNKAAQDQIQLSLKSLASVIKDIRNYIFDLRPQALKYKGLKARLEGLIKELRVNTLLPIHTEIASDIDSCLTDMQARHIFHIIHEALSNAARHAKPNQISVKLTRQKEKVCVIVEDDGMGFEWQSQSVPGHRGLSNIQTRVTELGATLAIDSAPNQGTQLTLLLHCGFSSDEA